MMRLGNFLGGHPSPQSERNNNSKTSKSSANNKHNKKSNSNDNDNNKDNWAFADEDNGELSLDDSIVPRPPAEHHSGNSSSSHKSLSSHSNSDHSSIENQPSHISVAPSTTTSKSLSGGLSVSVQHGSNHNSSNTSSNKSPSKKQQQITAVKERAKRLEAMEAKLVATLQPHQQQQHQPPKSSASASSNNKSKKSKGFFGRSSNSNNNSTPNSQLSASPLGHHQHSSSNDAPKKKKGLLKFFGGGSNQGAGNHKKKHERNNSFGSTNSKKKQQQTKASGGETPLEMESQATFTIRDLVPSSVEDNNKGPASSSFTTALTRQPPPVPPSTTTTAKAASSNAAAEEEDDNPFIVTSSTLLNFPNPSMDRDDCDNTTISNLTNPSIFQAKSKQQAQQPVQPQQVQPPQEPVMGDFFVEKPIDSWEEPKGPESWERSSDEEEEEDAFSDPFFGSNKNNNGVKVVPTITTTTTTKDASVFPTTDMIWKEQDLDQEQQPFSVIMPPSTTRRNSLSPSSAATQKQRLGRSVASSPKSTTSNSIRRKLRSPQLSVSTTKDNNNNTITADWTDPITKAVMEELETKQQEPKKGSTITAPSPAATTTAVSTPVQRGERKKLAERYARRRSESPSLDVPKPKPPSKKVPAVAEAYVKATSPKSESSSAPSDELDADKEKATTAKNANTNTNNKNGNNNAYTGRFSNRKQQQQQHQQGMASSAIAEASKSSTVSSAAGSSSASDMVPPPPPPPPPRRTLSDKAQMQRLRANRSSENQYHQTAGSQSVASDDSGTVSTLTMHTSSRKKSTQVSAVPKSISSTTTVKKRRSSRGSATQKIRVSSLEVDIHSQQPPSDTSVSSGTTTSSSVVRTLPKHGLQELRQILHRPRVHHRGRTPKMSGPLKTVFGCYDESQVRDPMARAGLRLLSSAVVPIQALVRRYLVERSLLTQQWATLVIQARFRAYVKQSRYQEQRQAATEIQRMARGMLVWERICLEDYCAMEIQRHVRGYLAYCRTIDTLTKVTLVQNLYRKRLAMCRARERSNCVLHLQAWARGSMVRQRLGYEHFCATEISRHVRGYLATLEVYEQIYNVCLVQNVVRQKQAVAKVQKLRENRRENMAVILQRYTRGYLATMFVYEEIFKIMLVQNLVRRRQAMKAAMNRMGALIQIQTHWRRYEVQDSIRKKHKAAINIQRIVRGRHASLQVWEDIYRITVVQSCYRQKKAKELADLRKEHVTRVGAMARGHLEHTKYNLQKQKAVTIQAVWRAYFYHLLFQFKLLDIIMLQTLWRKKSATKFVQRKRDHLHNSSATKIQSMLRGYSAHKAYVRQLLCIRSATMIQAQWRSYDAAMSFLHYLANVLTVQSFVRGATQRKIYSAALAKRRSDAAVEIQRMWRGFVRFADYLFTVSDIVVVQSLVRRWSAVQTAQNLREYNAANFIQQWSRDVMYRRRKAASKIQLHWLGFRDRSAFDITLKRNRASRTIQTAWRKFVNWADYQVMLSGSIYIQSSFRGFAARCRYYESVGRIVRIQSSIRWFCTRRKVLGQRLCLENMSLSQELSQMKSNSATLIQTSFRYFHARSKYVAFLSARRIQTNWRMSRDRSYYQQFMATRCIQNSWRASQSRSRLQTLKLEYCAATRIQAAFRGLVQYTDYLFVVCDILRIQSHARSYIQRKRYLKMKDIIYNSSASTIQAQWRSFTTCMGYRCTVADIIVVQSCVRRWSTVRHFAAKAFAACRIQNYWRKGQAILLLKKHLYARSIQSWFRSWRSKQRLASLKLEYRAATTISATWRGCVEYTNYFLALCDIVVVQSIARQRQAKKQLLLLSEERDHSAATKVQNAWRNFWTRKCLACDRAACTIQCQWRIYKAKGSLSLLRFKYKCATKIQATWRACVESTNYFLAVADIVLVQSIARMKASKTLVRRLKEERDTFYATKIQSICRSFSARATFSREKVDIIQVQACARRFIAKRLQQRLAESRFQHKNYCACKIQSSFRVYQARLTLLCLIADYVAASIIQSLWRRYSAQRSYSRALTSIIKLQCMARIQSAKQIASQLQLQQCSVVIQSKWRGYSAWVKFQKEVHQVITAQSCGRRYNARKELKQLQHDKASASAVVIQSAWRRFLCYTSYAFVLTDVVHVQACARGLFARRELQHLKDQRDVKAATSIQKTWRSFFFRTNYELIVSDIVCFQSYIRRFLARKEIPKRQRIRNNMCSIQIQAAWRCYYAVSNYALLYADIVKGQSFIRGGLARKTVGKLLAHKREQETRAMQTAAKNIQRSWRGHSAFASYVLAYSDILKVQSVARSLFASRKFKQLRYERDCQLATKIQKTWRRYLFYTSYVIILSDVIKVQSLFRSWLARRHANRVRHEIETQAASVIIQRYWRGYLGRMSLFIAWQQHVDAMNKTACKIQTIFRGYCQHQKYLYTIGSAIQMQSLARTFLVRTTVKRQQIAATRIQTLRRQFTSRMLMLDMLAQSIFQAAKNKPYGMTATAIQHRWRQHRHRSLKTRSARIIQSFMLQARETRKTRRRAAAFKITNVFRVVKCKLLLASMKQERDQNNAAVTITKVLRAVRCKNLLAKLKLERDQKEATYTLQLWYRVAKRVRDQKRLRAGRTILKFLRMVKAEVDRAIREEQKRRKFRQKMRNRTKELDEDMLETAWMKLEPTLSDKKSNKKKKQQQHSPNQSSSTYKKQQQEQRQSETVPRSDLFRREEVMEPEFVPPEYDIGSSYRVPTKPRMKTYNHQQIEEDFDLEEAYIDAEIYSAKQRRHAAKEQKLKQRLSYSRSNSSGGRSIEHSGSTSSSQRIVKKAPSVPRDSSSRQSQSRSSSRDRTSRPTPQLH